MKKKRMEQIWKAQKFIDFSKNNLSLPFTVMFKDNEIGGEMRFCRTNTEKQKAVEEGFIDFDKYVSEADDYYYPAYARFNNVDLSKDSDSVSEHIWSKYTQKERSNIKKAPLVDTYFILSLNVSRVKKNYRRIEGAFGVHESFFNAYYKDLSIGIEDANNWHIHELHNLNVEWSEPNEVEYVVASFDTVFKKKGRFYKHNSNRLYDVYIHLHPKTEEVYGE